jgi:hypothetical protein
LITTIGQLDGSAPELYERYLVPAITTKWADDLLGRARPRAGEEVLEIACGTGIVAVLDYVRFQLLATPMAGVTETSLIVRRPS